MTSIVLDAPPAIARAIPPALDRTSADALAARAFELRPVAAHERAGVLRGEAALLLDRLLARVARCRGALDVAVGERLAALAVGDRTLRLGFAGVGDYARERLGMAGRTAQDLARLARELKERPLLAATVRRGEVTARKAQTVLAVARGAAEAEWVERARRETVRALRAAVRAATKGGASDATAAAHPEDERWDRLWVALSPEQRSRLDEALALSARVLGATAPRWQRLEAICAEYLGAHGGGDDAEADGGAGPLCTAAPVPWLEAAKEALEEETRRWAFLDELSPVEPIAAPAPADATDALRLDAELRELAALRDRWDEVLGHLAMLLQSLGLWRDMRFASFRHYCTERLGLAPRTVEQRAALSRRLYALPQLRQALREGRVSYEKARLVASAADDETVAAWIARAEASTCIALRREVEAGEDRQMCARGELDLRLPHAVAQVLSEACSAARTVAGRFLTPGECLERIATHFIETWRAALPRPRTAQARAILRDGGVCQVPGCSRAAVHAHHVQYRSHGGGDDPSNLTALCAAHHLVGVHRGYLRVRGEAPHGLSWRLGLGPPSAALGVAWPGAVALSA